MDRAVANRPPRLPERAVAADFVFLLRPAILLPVWTFFLLGASHGARAGAAAPVLPLLAGIASFTAMMGAVYIVNQIADRESDRANGKLFLLSHGIVPARAAWTEAALLVAAALAAAALTLPRTFLAALCAGLLLGLGYSLEPVRLKRRPVLDLVASGLGSGLVNTLAGWTAIGAPLREIFVLAPYPLAVAAVHLLTTLADIEGDGACGLRTSGVALGRGKGTVAAGILMTASAGAAAAAGNTVALICALVSLPLFMMAARRGRAADDRAVLMPARAATLCYSAAAAVFYPVYLAWLAAVLALTRLYYSRRFGIRYPSI
ncbi:MAG: UbiA family prenyltransferase [Candidatus Krumholzibacteria bacterium]|nr:UbiA family prenyltransferase [Candidatus Krumholzibacteria bacterium]